MTFLNATLRERDDQWGSVRRGGNDRGHHAHGSSTRLRVLIAEHEECSRGRLRSLLARLEDLDIVAECQTGTEAVAATFQRNPHLMLLAVSLPDMDGFDVLAAVGGAAIPVAVFLATNTEHALRAFEVRAVDFLLKPVDPERLRRAVQRAKQEVEHAVHNSERQLVNLRATAQASSSSPRRLAVRSDGRVFFVPVDDIDWIEAADNYVRLHVGKTTYLMRSTMQRMESILDPREFLRIHRSVIIRVAQIREIQRWNKREYLIILRCGTRLTSSRSYRDMIDVLINGS